MSPGREERTPRIEPQWLVPRADHLGHSDRRSDRRSPGASGRGTEVPPQL